jgi:hypothetical protein
MGADSLLPLKAGFIIYRCWPQAFSLVRIGAGSVVLVGDSSELGGFLVRLSAVEGERKTVRPVNDRANGDL